MQKPTVVFLLNSISQPRCIKRINSFIRNGYAVKVYGINRGKYNENARISGVEIEVFDKQSSGDRHFLKFVKNNIKLYKLYKQHNSPQYLFYSFGFSLTIFLWLFRCRRYVYEISDIVYGYSKYARYIKLLKKIDRCVVKRSILTVLTSDGFVDFLFENKSPQNIIVQPNKVSSSLYKMYQRNSYKHLSTDKIIFSFIGALRYPNTVFRFAKVIGQKFSNHEFHFYGDSHLREDVIKLSEGYSNVKYFGSFKSPDDLSKIYSKIDFVIACYDTKSLNERIAEPNKLYEAMFFMKPILVSSNTFLAERVNELGCGYSIDASLDSEIERFVSTLTVEEINAKMNVISQISIDEIVDDDSLGIIKHLYNVGF